MYGACDVKRLDAINVSMGSHISMLCHVLCCVVLCCVVLCCVVLCCVVCAETRNEPIMSKKST
jgi:Flp pilus assembly protein protease CpaA